MYVTWSAITLRSHQHRHVLVSVLNTLTFGCIFQALRENVKTNCLVEPFWEAEVGIILVWYVQDTYGVLDYYL